MKINIEVEVDDLTGSNYQDLSTDCKQRLIAEIGEVLKTTVNNERVTKLKTLLQELQNETGGTDFDPEILYDLLRKEDD
ncbi:MAG: hypothetical protein K0Q79_800 [Flavipsychrobacter sp.]|jgi:hypothetical protein|nr:hypothetical protein [Flavipsychrobacter sp.]